MKTFKRTGITTKKKILDVASRVFSKYGYAGANMRMIAGGANLGVGSLYLYFKNKEDIYLTLMKARMNEFSDKTTAIIQEIADPSEALSTFITMSLDYAQKYSAFILLQGREHMLASGLAMKKEFFKKQRNLIENIVKQGIRSGVFRNVNVQETAKIIFSMITGFRLSIVVDPGSLFSPDACNKLILNGLVWRGKK